MLNDFEALTVALLDEHQYEWLASEIDHVRHLAARYVRTPWLHNILCDNYWPRFNSELSKKCDRYWPGFDTELSKKKRREGWGFAEWIVIRERVRIELRESFHDVGQWVDEWPLLDWQMAEVEDAYFRKSIHCPPGKGAARRL